MKKTVTVSIARTQFVFEEDAHDALASYLRSLHEHFESDVDKSEIIADIEARIAEKLIESKRTIIDIDTISALMTEMGRIEELDGESEKRTASKRRMLYRDDERAIIAGVAAGIAAYFDIDPIVIRLLFLLSIFAGGTGLAIYLVLWILVPIAKTPSQKLEMRGEAITLDSVREIIKEKARETRERGTLHRAANFPVEVARTLVAGLKRLARPFARLIGALLVIGAFFAILGATIATALALTNIDARSIDLPLRDMVPTSLLYSVISAYYAVVVLPLVLILLAGVRLVRSHLRMGSAVGFALIGLWSISLIIAIVLSVRIAGEYKAHIDTDPAYARITRSIAPEEFHSIVASRSDVRVVHGDTYAIEVTGRTRDIDRESIAIAHDTLTLNYTEPNRVCVFCIDDGVTVTVVTPALSSITVDHGHLSLEKVESEALSLTTASSRVDGSVTLGSLSLDARTSSIELSGAIRNATLTLTNSDLDMQHAKLTDATLNATDWSSARLSPAHSFKRDVDRTSILNEFDN